MGIRSSRASCKTFKRRLTLAFIKVAVLTLLLLICKVLGIPLDSTLEKFLGFLQI
jgi:hypothetical protein